MPPRFLEKFTSASGGLSYTFPLSRYEYQPQQSLRLPTARTVGQDYAYDLLASTLAPREVGREVVRFAVVENVATDMDDELDDMAALLFRAGRGKLYTLGADATRRWAWARLVEMPSMTITPYNTRLLPVSLSFLRLSDWFDSSATTDTEVVTADEQQWTVTNPGDLPARLMTIQIIANAAGGITNPVITNLTNGYVLASTRDSAAEDDEIKLDTEAGTIEYSADAGATFADDFAEYTVPTDQPVLSFQLEPGANTIQYEGGGTINCDVVFTWYAPRPR